MIAPGDWCKSSSYRMLGQCCGENPPITAGWRHVSVAGFCFGFDVTPLDANFLPIPVEHFRQMRVQRFTFTDSANRTYVRTTTFPQFGTWEEAQTAFQNPVIVNPGTNLNDTTPWSDTILSADQLTETTTWYTNAGKTVVNSRQVYQFSVQNDYGTVLADALSILGSIDIRGVAANQRPVYVRGSNGQVQPYTNPIRSPPSFNGASFMADHRVFQSLTLGVWSFPQFVFTKSLYVSASNSPERFCVVESENHPSETNTACFPPPLTPFLQDRTLEPPSPPDLVVWLKKIQGVEVATDRYERRRRGYIMGGFPTPPTCCNAVPPP